MSRPEWHLEDLWLSLREVCPEISVEWLPELDSTNSELARRLRAGSAESLLLVAEHQTAGRGRMGRSWLTPPGSALTFSLALPMQPATWSGLSLAVGLLLTETLDPQGQMGLGVKWPNDIWHWPPLEAPTKLGGILIETLPLPTQGSGRYAIVGVGINLRTPAIDTGGIAARGLDYWGAVPETGRLLARIARPLLSMLKDFERVGPQPWLARYAQRDLLRGVELQTSLGVQGLGAGIDDGGGLLLDTPDGPCRVDSAEVSVRPTMRS